MAVFLIEIPDTEDQKLTVDDVQYKLNIAFNYADVKVRSTSNKTFKDYDWQQEYDATMGAG